ncbi:cupin domain-containing protein [Methylorubrum rhodinum]|uniref:Quercetin dioxygenase-like cupin family protein n=1 Tax=Methylorubrum rhodinum TaxID=29428 RepID=A0A840ZKA2_9HYPH|nr:quercetin dioxygenase-like cupin family protein [Methylorubrum rhodinum]
MSLRSQSSNRPFPPSPRRTGVRDLRAWPRTAWHTHPAGQTLVVTAGLGWVQERGGQKREIRPGDVIWIPPGVEHWHGATTTNAMIHIAIQKAVDGKVVSWLERVEYEHYRD